MKQYVNYDYYENTYCGRMISEDDFDRLAIEASYFIDGITMGRVDAENPLEEVKMACCSVAEICYLEHKEESDGVISSEKVGEHSISYGNRSKNKSEYELDKMHTARIFLARTGLLYRGIPYCNF